MKGFIIKYAGMPLRLPELMAVEAVYATTYESEQDAWYAAGHSGLAFNQLKVVPAVSESDRIWEAMKPVVGGAQ